MGWRKACADVFMPVSCVCSPTVRQTELSPLFINLLRDQSRWVRMAAFQALGPFISTFADPAITALLHNENGEIVITDPDQLAERLNSLGMEDESAGPCNQHKSSLSSTESSKTQPNCSSQNYQNNNRNTQETLDINTVNNNTVQMETDDDNWAAELITTSNTSPEERRAAKYLTTVESSKSNYVYSSFLYWRDPVPDLDLVDVDLDDHDLDHQVHDETELDQVSADFSKPDVESSANDGTPKATEKLETPMEEKTEEQSEDKKEEDNSKEVEPAEEKNDSSALSESTEPTGSQENSTMELFRPSDKEAPANICTFDPQSRWETYSNSSIHSSRSSLDSNCMPSTTDIPPPDPALPKGPPETEQSIVPQLLIDHYVSMIDPSRAQTVDNDIARHCAFSLPAVALTLGRANWPLLKETYESLANDMQWKVRRTLANSIHELAVILGPEVASQDLVPIFNGFIKDLDEVRIRVLKHLADFLSLLSPEARAEYLPRLEEFLKMDNDRNWRFRFELCSQVAALVPLCTSEEVLQHLAPLCLLLVNDRVSEVRRTAAKVTASLLAHLSRAGEAGVGGLAMALVSVLARDNHWARRQTFVLLCGALQGEEGGMAVLTSKLLPPLLLLADDPVPNVRLSLASLLHSDAGRSLEGGSEVLARLLDDTDRDVRAAGGAEVEPALKLKGNKLEAEMSSTA